VKAARTATALGLVLGLPALCLGHGTGYAVVEGGTGVKATYDDGSPMAYCDVAVFAPGDPSTEYQTGTTDRNGCFAFFPDTNGNWRVTVDDGMGHLVTANIVVGPEMLHVRAGANGRDRLGRSIVGVSVIFGVFGILSLFSRRVRSAGKMKSRGTGKP